MSMTNTTIREVDIASNATVGDKMCPVHSVRPMLLTTATVDGAKVVDERGGRSDEGVGTAEVDQTRNGGNRQGATGPK